MNLYLKIMHINSRKQDLIQIKPLTKITYFCVKFL